MDSEQLHEGAKKALVCRDARLFNRHILAAEAFKWDLGKMLDFLGDAARSLGHYGVHRDHQQTLVTAVEKLERLSDTATSRAFLTADKTRLDPIDINWESVHLKCHSQYEVLGLVLSILGRAPPGATRHDHHLPLLILCVRFVLLAAGEKPKRSAPSLVSIMFTDDDDGDFQVQVACDVPECPELEDPVDGPGLSAITESADLNFIMGTTIFQARTDLPEGAKQSLRTLMLDARYDFLANEGGYTLPGRDVGQGNCFCGSCGETFGFGLLRQYVPFLPYPGCCSLDIFPVLAVVY